MTSIFGHPGYADNLVYLNRIPLYFLNRIPILIPQTGPIHEKGKVILKQELKFC